MPSTIRDVRSRARTLTTPVVLFVVALVLIVALLVLWNVVLAIDYQRIRDLAARATQEGGGVFHTTFIALGSALFVAAISLLSVMGAILIQEIRFNQRQSAFIATFTHELNSPLAAIKLFAQTLQRSELPEAERRRFVDLILSDVERLRGQIANVLRAAQLENPQGIALVAESVDLRAFVQGALEARRAALVAHEGKVALELAPGDSPCCTLDRHLIREALDNLLDNAIKYALPAGVRVQVRVLAASSGRAAIEVEDDGCGIDPRDLERIFDRFGRARENPEAARRRGTGLGLWIVRAIARAHGGEVIARSLGVGRGATFRIELPVDPAPGEEAPAGDARPRAAGGSAD